MNLYRAAFLHIKTFPSAFWVVLSATLMNQIGNMGIVFLVLYLNQHLGFSLSQASIAFAVFSGSMLVAGMVSGGLIDQSGALRVMIGALCANGLTLLLFPLTHTYSAILFMCLIWGTLYGLYRPASQTFVSQLSAPGIHKLTFSLYRLTINLGMSIGPALGGYLAYHSFAAIYVANGFANLLASLILIAGLAHSGWLDKHAAARQKLSLNIRWLKYDPLLRLFVIGMIPVSMVFFQHESTLAVFLKRDLGFSLSFYGLLFTLNTFIIVFCELPLNVATMNWPYRINFLLGSLLITAGFAGLYFATREWHIILLTVIWTAGEMILYPAASSYIADIAPSAHRGSYMSLYSTCSNLGILLGPWAGAIVMEKTGAQGLWIACGIWGMLSMIIFNYLRESKQLGDNDVSWRTDADTH
ncbi:MFS transporter [Aquicella lusitana]|uniref:Putative MFS family arabinose efflux permease n=1 Tax=Aquicella lusitana TaxID=254246 RepID=A0A370H3Q1_9COXI|nr:MFS transporter [Aquicella lusitana]RDI48683.1 putative MFS family arabinose efflux permease [Aquicella lusitana]VVC73940.1 hypothetical protein AQULUS_17010 [Aquicella lusitana]